MRPRPGLANVYIVNNGVISQVTGDTPARHQRANDERLDLHQLGGGGETARGDAIRANTTTVARSVSSPATRHHRRYGCHWQRRKPSSRMRRRNGNVTVVTGSGLVFGGVSVGGSSQQAVIERQCGGTGTVNVTLSAVAA